MEDLVDRDILFVSNALANGGAARVLCLLANTLAARGHRVGVLSFKPHVSEFPLDDAVKKSYGPSMHGPLGRFRRIQWIREAVQRNPRATVVAFEYFVNMQTILACSGLGNRVVVSERNDPARVGNGFPKDALRKVLYGKASLLVCQTEEAANYFPKSIRKTVILNPIKPDLPQPTQGMRRKAVVTFSRLEPQKNLEMLIRSFDSFHRKHPDYTLEIHGDGSEKSLIEQLIESLNLTDSVYVFPASLDIHNLVRDSAMFVLSSDYEGLSNSMLEAMALGLPTICTDCPCGGARMVIEHGSNGLLVGVGDVEALAEAMCRVADDAALAMRLSRRAENIRERLSIDSICNQWGEAIFS